MMKAPAQRRTPRAPAAPARPATNESEWRHGPVSAAINTSIVALLAAAVIRLTGLPAGLTLVVGAVMAVVLVAAGRMRQPRPLALRSLVYRAATMVIGGVWMWLETADFARVAGGALSGLLLCLAAVVAVAVGVVAARYGHGWWAAGAAVAALCFAGGGVPLVLNSNVTSVFAASAPIDRSTYLPWLWHAFLAAAILTAVFSVLGASCANHEAALDEAAERALMMRSHGREMLSMQTLLREVTRAANLRVIEFDKWANGAGEDYVIDGTADGITPAELNVVRDTLAARLDLPNGCGVEAVQGVSRGRIVVAVSRVNRIKDFHGYPDNYEQRSIYNGLPIGVLRDGKEVSIMLRESSAFVWGQKRSGKTTTLYDIIAGLCQCTDAMIWVIDMGGGGAAIPFLYPYAEDRAAAPAIDWVATTIDEAKKMADTALAIALDRKVYYKHRKRAGGTNLLPLDSEVPEIVIVIDEGAEIMGESTGMSYEAKEVRGVLEKTVRTAGDSGVNIVFSGLAATQEVIDRMTLAQLAIRVGMRVTEARELAYGFDGDYGLNPADVPYQGSGFVKPDHESGTRVFKAFGINPPQMDEIAVATADWRPNLDERGKEIGGAIYARRWARTAHLLTDENGHLLIDPVNGGRNQLADPAAPAPLTGSAALPTDPAGGGAEPGPPTLNLPATPIPQAPGPMLPGATPPAPPTPASSDNDEVLRQGLRPFHVAGSPDDVIRRADESAARLESAAAAAAEGDDQLAGEAADLADLVGDVDLNDGGAVDRRFEAMMRRGFDFADPGSWAEPPAPPGIETQRNPHGPEVLEAMVRFHGPGGMTAKEIHTRLPAGGDWGPKVDVSMQAVHDWLKKAEWLAPRQPRSRYVHRDFGPTAP